MNPPDPRVRRLAAADLALFRPLRLDALRLHPEAFTSSYEDEYREPPEAMMRLLAPPAVMFGGFDGDALVGMTGLIMQTRSKSRHKVHMVSVYVDAAHRRTGLARALLEAAIAHACDSGASVLQLTVTQGNAAARRLYAAMGFQTYGIERRALRIDDVFYDNELMALDLAFWR
jgi:ribosomal protein S18 acetylase RimI-like enzyme